MFNNVLLNNYNERAVFERHLVLELGEFLGRERAQQRDLEVLVLAELAFVTEAVHVLLRLQHLHVELFAAD